MTKSTLRFALCAVALLAVAALAAHMIDLKAAAVASGLGGGTALAMAVVTKYGTAARDPAGNLRQLDGIFAAAEKRFIVSQVSITNGDSINSVFYIGELPSNAIIDPDSTYDYEAVAGCTDVDVGFYQPLGKGGAVIDADNLVDGDDIATAGSQTLKGHATLTTANGHKRAWELAGLATDPGGNLALGLKLNAAATATKVVNFRIGYLKAA